MSNQPQPSDIDNDAALSQAKPTRYKYEPAHASELSNYVETCVTFAKAVRWLTFAISVSSGGLLLLLATFYQGNLEYAKERRKEIQTQCFDKRPVLDSEQGILCANFVKDQLEKEIKFLPTPAGIQSGIPTTTDSKTTTTATAVNMSEDLARQSAEAHNKEAIASFNQREAEMRVVQLPLVNIRLLITDFAPLLALLSVFFLYWLRLNLEFARNTLCGLYNDYLSASRATRTVPAHFVLLWPGGSRRKSHWVFWAILYSIIVSVSILILTDLIDFFATGARHSIPISQQAGWSAFRFYAWGKIAFESFLMFLAAYTIYRLKSIVRDVRNVLLLIEWTPSAFYPILYSLFAGKTSPLLEGANETSYDEYGPGFFCLRVRLTFPNDPDNPKPDESEEKVFYARVDLWKSASYRSSFDRKIDWRQLFSREEWVRSLAEERRMRVFFFNMFTNPGVEREFCYEFWRTAKERELNGNWMSNCDEEFKKEADKPQATTDEIVQRTGRYEK